MTNTEIARALSETAALIELTGGNAFRARAISNAARTIRGLDVPVQKHLKAGTLTDIDGIGRGLAAQVEELVERGSFELRDELFNAVPHGLPAVLRVKGLGPKKVRRLWKELNVTSLDDLEAAAETNRIVDLDGFGPKTQAKILDNVRLQKEYDAKRRLDEALDLAGALIRELEGLGDISQVRLAGELRRNFETVDRIELVAAADDPESVSAKLAGYEPPPDGASTLPGAVQLLRSADGNLPVHLTMTSPERFGTALWHRTGSTAHSEAFAERYGAPPLLSSEADIYADAGLPPIPPEIREGTGELEAAASGTLPALIETEDLRGTLHNHTTYSDGKHSLREMVDAARAMGLSYFGVCDHSQSLTIAGGLSLEEVTRQQQEIAQLNDELSDAGAGFRVFSGIESDILPDGSLDYPEEVLVSFDFVVASVHSRFGMSVDEATERVVRAVKNPFTSILGHATGRLLLVRRGYSIHHERVIEACAQHNVAIELNANPYRLDMDWRFLREATEAGVLISINPDAHSIDELHHVRWGVAVARKAWLTSERCLNAFSLPSFEEWIHEQAAKVK